MERDTAIQLLASSRNTLQENYGVLALGLFGSTARNQATADSDIDLLVCFDGVVTSKQYFGALFFLEDLFQRPIDLVTNKALRPELRPYVEEDLIHVWQPSRSQLETVR
ncbi:MAG: nucleotidyltransferase family protein [Cyanophyceae cyanobacterium]